MRPGKSWHQGRQARIVKGEAIRAQLAAQRQLQRMPSMSTGSSSARLMKLVNASALQKSWGIPLLLHGAILTFGTARHLS